jgi:starch phosphorylase
LIDYVRRRLVRQMREHGADEESIDRAGRALDPNALTIGFARRFAPYKRPGLLLQNKERLERILRDDKRPVQLIVAGKAHPNDGEGRRLVQEIAKFASQPEISDRVVFLEDYDMALAQKLEPGIDLWVNVPKRPMEACGTSGMKVLVNGGLNLSELDGWWDEAYTPEVGWALGDGKEHEGKDWDAIDANQLYQLLENKIVPEFYERDQEDIPRAWIDRVRASMSQLTHKFASYRMMREYIEKMYMPSATAYRRRIADGALLAAELYEWQKKLAENWNDLHFGNITASREGNSLVFGVQVYFGKMNPDMIKVELYADPIEREEPMRVVMTKKEPIIGADDGFLYESKVPGDRSAWDYTPRIVPYHPEASIPIEEAHILWHH